MTPLKKFKILMSATNEHVYFTYLMINENSGTSIMISPIYKGLSDYSDKPRDADWELHKYNDKTHTMIKCVTNKTEILEYLKENDLTDMRKFTKDDFTQLMLRFDLI